MPILFLILFIFTTGSPAFADPPSWYLGTGYSGIIVEQTPGQDGYLDAIALRGGWYFNEFFALEGRGLRGISSDSVSTQMTEGTLQLNDAYSLYIRADYPVASLVWYGLIGYTHADFSLRSSGVRKNSERKDYSFAGGVEWRPVDAWGVGIEYLQLIAKPDQEIVAATLGLTRYF